MLVACARINNAQVRSADDGDTPGVNLHPSHIEPGASAQVLAEAVLLPACLPLELSWHPKLPLSAPPELGSLLQLQLQKRQPITRKGCYVLHLRPRGRAQCIGVHIAIHADCVQRGRDHGMTTRRGIAVMQPICTICPLRVHMKSGSMTLATMFFQLWCGVATSFGVVLGLYFPGVVQCGLTAGSIGRGSDSRKQFICTKVQLS